MGLLILGGVIVLIAICVITFSNTRNFEIVNAVGVGVILLLLLVLGIPYFYYS